MIICDIWLLLQEKHSNPGRAWSLGIVHSIRCGFKLHVEVIMSGSTLKEYYLCLSIVGWWSIGIPQISELSFADINTATLHAFGLTERSSRVVWVPDRTGHKTTEIAEMFQRP